jgi:oligopeptide transport system permease protein
VLAALRANSWLDYALTAGTSVSMAVPNFLVGALLIHVVSVRFGLLPTSGWGTWRYTLLPSLALGLAPLGYVIQIVRGTMLETLAQDYIRAARAKGLTRGRLVFVHVVRNSLIPLITAAGPMLGLVIAGAFVIENIFSIPGIGRYFVIAVQARDDGVVMGLTVVIALTIIICNLVVDVLYAFLDPRLRDTR